MITLLLMAVVSLPSMAQYKITETVNSDIPEGYARVTLITHNIWAGFDGTGYQMLLDQDGDTYGRIIPKTGNFTEYGMHQLELMMNLNTRYLKMPMVIYLQTTF